ncbi:unnamed protein product, partial [Meganyctiphanes norvegica]
MDEEQKSLEYVDFEYIPRHTVTMRKWRIEEFSAQARVRKTCTSDKNDYVYKDKSQRNSMRISKKKIAEKVNSSTIENGQLVWVKVKGSRPWPAIVVEAEKCGLASLPARAVMVFWLGDGRFGNVKKSNVSDITEIRERYFTSASTQYKKSVCQLLKYASERVGEIQEAEDFENLTQWAKIALKQPPEFFRPKPGQPTYPMKVITCLQRIQKYNNSQTEHGKREWKKKGRLLREVRMGRKAIEDICISCPAVDVKITAKHPVFIGGTCQTCEDDLQLDEMMLDEQDGKSMWCAVCAQPGPVLACGNLHCERVFCINCIGMFNGEKELTMIQSTPEWSCYGCTTTDGLLKLRTTSTIQNKTQRKILKKNRVEIFGNSSRIRDACSIRCQLPTDWGHPSCSKAYDRLRDAYGPF